MIKGDKPSTEMEKRREGHPVSPPQLGVTKLSSQAFVLRYQSKGLGGHEEVWTPAPASWW